MTAYQMFTSIEVNDMKQQNEQALFTERFRLEDQLTKHQKELDELTSEFDKVEAMTMEASNEYRTLQMQWTNKQKTARKYLTEILNITSTADSLIEEAKADNERDQLRLNACLRMIRGDGDINFADLYDPTLVEQEKENGSVTVSDFGDYIQFGSRNGNKTAITDHGQHSPDSERDQSHFGALNSNRNCIRNRNALKSAHSNFKINRNGNEAVSGSDGDSESDDDGAFAKRGPEIARKRRNDGNRNKRSREIEVRGNGNMGSTAEPRPKRARLTKNRSIQEMSDEGKDDEIIIKINRSDFQQFVASLPAEHVQTLADALSIFGSI